MKKPKCRMCGHLVERHGEYDCRAMYSALQGRVKCRCQLSKAQAARYSKT